MIKNIFYFLFWVNLVWCSDWSGLDNEIPNNMKQCYAPFISRLREKLAIYEKQERELKETDAVICNLKNQIYGHDSADRKTRLEMDALRNENNQLKRELSSKVEFIIGLEAEVKRKNGEIEKVKNEIQNSMREEKIVQKIEKLSSRYLETFEFKLNEMNTNFEKLVNDMNQNIVKKIKEKDEFEKTSLRSSLALEYKALMDKNIENREMEKNELTQKCIRSQEIIEKKDIEIMQLQQNLFRNIQETNGSIKNLTQTITKLVVNKESDDLEIQKSYYNLPDILNQMNQEILSSREKIMIYICDQIGIIKRSNNELLEDQLIIREKDEEFTKMNLEIEVLRQRVSEYLVTIQDLREELNEKKFQFNSNIQIKQSEIDHLNNLNMKLQFEISQYNKAAREWM
jgi:hypothetical protein